ncbi:hypothetical protein D3C83_224420 [compost metagenome]
MFDTRAVFDVGVNPMAVATADFDEDGALDVIVVATESAEDWLRPDSVWSGGALSVLLSDP